jgi:hypothetical protein
MPVTVRNIKYVIDYDLNAGHGKKHWIVINDRFNIPTLTGIWIAINDRLNVSDRERDLDRTLNMSLITIQMPVTVRNIKYVIDYDLNAGHGKKH